MGGHLPVGPSLVPMFRSFDPVNSPNLLQSSDFVFVADNGKEVVLI